MTGTSISASLLARGASVAAAAVVTTALAAPAHAAGPPQVTAAEYAKVKPDMAISKVNAIIGSKGKLEFKSPQCMVRSYSGWSRQTVSIQFMKNGGVWQANLKSAEVNENAILACFSMRS